MTLDEHETQLPQDQHWMLLALEQARVAAARGEVPVGAVVVRTEPQVLVASAHNLRETLDDPTAHAELLALRWASQELRSWRLDDCTLYVTLEPCPMCAGALVNARMGRVVYGCADPKAGAVDTLYALGQDTRLNHRFAHTAGVLAEPCAQVLKDFFLTLRQRNKRKSSG
jgi:tRNA(adenine34) deaminase